MNKAGTIAGRPAWGIAQWVWSGSGSSWVVGLALLAASALWPESDLMSVLKGEPRLGAELRHANTRGYYEELIDAGGLSRRETDPDAPPPDWVPFGASGIIEPVSTYLRWRMRPNLDMVWNGVPFKTNGRGYRTPEVPLKKPEGVYRIVVFGSSNTMGHGVGDDDAYPRLLERWLNGLEGLDKRIEIVNLAVSGESPSRRLLRMREEARQYEPDWILCDATALDPSLEERHLQAIVHSSPPIPIPFEYVSAALGRAGVSLADSPREFESKLRGEAQALLEGAYEGWRDFSARAGVPFTVVIIPRADEKRDNPVIHKLMRDSFRRLGLDCLDAHGAFDDLSVDQFRVSPWDKHPSVLGHQAIFEALRDALSARGTLPGLRLPG